MCSSASSGSATSPTAAAGFSKTVSSAPASRSREGVDTASRRVVEDDAEGVALAGAQAADAVTHRHPVGAAGALDRPMVDREDHRPALLQRHDFAARLRPRPLLDQQELTAGKV